MSRDENTKTSNIPKHPNVEISVRNFGPIAAADLDLRPLTVFVGPSNTGKTYLSILIYVLRRVFEGFSGFPSVYILRFLQFLAYAPVSSVDKTELRKELLEALDKLRGQPFKFSDLPKKVRERTQVWLKSPDLGAELKTELERCFDLDSVSGLIRSPGGQNDEITVSLMCNEENQALWSFKMGASESEVAVDGQVNENTVIFPEYRLPPTSQISFEYMVELFHHQHRRSTTGKPYYLPAARSGIMQSHRVIASSLVTRSTRAGLERFPEIPTLSGVIADFMQQIILYEERARPDDGMNHIADALASDVLDGQIITKPSPTGYPEFLYRPRETEEEIRLTRASSMVSELAPFVLFLRGLIRPGDTLIIEEPEAHLHPAAQTQMAATLARLVRARVRVLVTTHSDWMLQEIGNLMRVGMLKEKRALRNQTNDWLLPEEVGAWHFQKDQPVKEIRFDHTVGVEPEDYEDLAESLYNRWAGLQNQLEETKGESELECE